MMIGLEAISLWLSIAFYVFAFIFLLVEAIFKKNVLNCLYPTLAGFCFHTISGILRWSITSHPPVLSGYENSLSGSWFVILIGIILAFRFRVSRYFLLFLIPFSLLMLGNGLMSGRAYEPLTPSFKSPWLAVHVLFAWLAYGSFTVAAAIGFYYLVLYYSARGEEEKMRKLDDLNLRLAGFGFISHTIMIGAGAIWAYGLWGSYWSWDPVETWSLITWLAYGINIHLQLTMNWRGIRGALLTVLCLITVIITYFGLGLIHEFHIRLL